MNCPPDCDERTNCDRAGQAGHTQCGRCPRCGEPLHHGCSDSRCKNPLRSAFIRIQTYG